MEPLTPEEYGQQVRAQAIRAHGRIIEALSLGMRDIRLVARAQGGAYWASVFFLVLLVSALALSAEAQPGNGELTSLRFEAAEVGESFVLNAEDKRFLQAESGASCEFWGQAFDLPSALRAGRNSIEVGIRVAYEGDETKLAEAWNAFKLTNFPNRSLEFPPGDFGDDARGTYPIFLVLRKGHAMVRIRCDFIDPVVSGENPVSEEEQVALMTRIKDKALQKIEAIDQPAVTPLEVDFQIVPNANPIRITASASPSPFPVGFSGGLTSLSTGTYDPNLLDIEFAPDRKLDFSLPNLPPGNYLLDITAMDALGRSESFEYNFSVGPPSSPNTETRSSTKDALIYEKSPHSNEGVNPILTLEKINGKAARNLLGFDLSSVNTSALTSAILVLSIDPSDQVTGWGNGETVTVDPVTIAWQEGNGKSYGLSNNQKFAGSGSGTTWFSPIDENISNTCANSVTQWNGGATYASQGTAPGLIVNNHQTGELRFDVTQDVINGAPNGWLLRKEKENQGSKVSFYSKEGAGAAGKSDLAPRLILECGNTSAQAPSTGVLARLFNFYHGSPQLTAVISESERPTLKRTLQQSPVAAFVGEQFVTGFAGQQPFVKMGVRAAYRSWLRGTPTLVLEGLESVVS